MKTNHSPKNRLLSARPWVGQAFTLVELLVVMVVIGILAGMVLPALAKSKGKAQSMICLNNLKQLQLAWLTYPEDNNDRVPSNQLWDGPEDFPASAPGNWVVGNARIEPNNWNIKKGVLFPYVKASGSYRCPTDRSDVDGHPCLPRARSYSLNGVLGFTFTTYWECKTNPVPAWSPRIQTTLSQIAQSTRPSPSELFVFLDEHADSIDDGFMECSQLSGTWQNNWLSLPADRHNRGSNLSFADGHVERWKWLSPKKFQAHGQGVTSSKDLLDLRKFQAAAP